MYGGSEQDIQFQKQIPVNLTYQTAYVDDEGKLQIKRDIYNIDGRMANAIKSERGMVEVVAQERTKEQAPRTTGTAQRRQEPPRRQVGFFEALFGGGNQKPTPPSRVR
jgi:hypothetical protein